MGLISALEFGVEFWGICLFIMTNSKIILKYIFRNKFWNRS